MRVWVGVPAGILLVQHLTCKHTRAMPAERPPCHGLNERAVPDSCFRRRPQDVSCPLSVSVSVFVQHHDFNVRYCGIVLQHRRQHRDILTRPIQAVHNLLLAVHRLPLAPVSGSWIRPSSRWSVGWEVDTAFIGQTGSTNHSRVLAQMPSGAPGGRGTPQPMPLRRCHTALPPRTTHELPHHAQDHTRLPECAVPDDRLAAFISNAQVPPRRTQQQQSRHPY